MNKQRLLTSAAVVALMVAPCLADTEVSSDRTTALTTGALLSSGVGDANAGNITIDSGISVAITKESNDAITIDSSHYLLNKGAISNKDTSSAYGLHIDVSTNPNLSGTSFTNAAGTTITGSGIYFDSSSSLVMTGDGSSKTGLFFDGAIGDGTYTGDVIFNAASMTINGDTSKAFNFGDGTTFRGDLIFDSTAAVTMTGDSSQAIYLAYGSLFSGDIVVGSSASLSMSGDSNTGVYMASGSELTGSLTVNGAIGLSQATARSTSSSSLYGMLLAGKINGDLVISSTGSVTVVGASATGISVQGYGINGAVAIGGSLSSVGYSSSSDTSTSNTTISTYPEAGSALAVGANVTDGIAVLGPRYSGDSSVSSASITTQGTSPALSINPGLNTVVTQTAPLVIGIYSRDGAADTYDPGFSFYNRGSITASPLNTNNSSSAVYTVGTSVFPTILTGGMYNSGSISASASSSSDGSAVTASGLYIGGYTYLDNATFDTATTTWTDATLAAKTSKDQAALVNSNSAGSGTISATISGYKSGAATAISIAQYASVPSLINSGTISASATTVDKTLDTALSSSNTYTLEAIAISDASGTLTSIYNTGIISAVAGVSTSSSSSVTALDNNNQLAVAIDLSGGNTATPSGSGVTIKERTTASSSAAIIGNIYFGTGDNQVIDVAGTSSTYTATINGNIHYGNTGANSIVDQLNIGAYGAVTGKVTAGSGPGVAVEVASNGSLSLLNDTTSFNAASVHIANAGSLSLAVSQSLTDTGVIDSQGTVVMDKGANLFLAYSSFVPQGSHDFVLITTPYGQLNVDPTTISVTNTYLTKNVTDKGMLPFLFESAKLEQTSSAAAGDALVLHVAPKTASQLGLTGYASSLFPYVNTALSNDNDLGSAMIYGIHNAADAQTAYAAFAPNVTGGDRAIVISLTDQSTGVVAARQRALLLYAKQGGEGTSFWFDEFIQQIKDPGQGAEQIDGTRAFSGFKDSGFGFSMGIDGGSPKYGWYGGAFTFYAGDVGELQRVSKTHEQWMILSGYSVWRGKGMFFNSKLDVGYGHLDSSRSITLTTASSSTSVATYSRQADNKHAGALLSGGVSTGAFFNFGAATFTPKLNIDGLLMRQDGYTEYNPGTATTGDAFDLKVQPSYAKSLRVFLGADLRYDIDVWDFKLQPEARAGYRYDLLNDPQKLKVAFAYADLTGTIAKPGETFTVTGPDPAQGNFVLGGSLSATTDAWSLGLHFDFVKGSNGALEQVGTLSLIGRI